MADYLNIAGRIRTTASDGVAMEAQEVKDLNLNKSQQEINADVQTDLGDRYTKEETYNREELNELITTPDVNRVYVIATNLTTAVTDLLPATGSSDTLYNVGNWDGTQYDTTVYSIYGWDGTAYVCLAVRSFVGEVYDISANHPDGQGNPTPYANLTAALGTNGANVPVGIRRGGMRIQFIKGTVQSSDNKYVQARCMAQDFTTDVTQWQGVDDEPKAGSKNLVESGGVHSAIGDSTIVDETSFTVAAGKYISYDTGAEGSSQDFYFTYKLPVEKGKYSTVKGCVILKNTAAAAIAFYRGSEISTDGYLKSVSVQGVNTNGKQQLFQANIPKDCGLIVITSYGAVAMINVIPIDYGGVSLADNIHNSNTGLSVTKEFEVVSKIIKGDKTPVIEKIMQNYCINNSNNPVHTDNFDLYGLPNIGYQSIHVKTYGVSIVNCVVFYSVPYMSSDDVLSSISYNGLFEDDIDIPSGCKFIAISNRKEQLISPEIKVTYGSVNIDDENIGENTTFSSQYLSELMKHIITSLPSSRINYISGRTVALNIETLFDDYVTSYSWQLRYSYKTYQNGSFAQFSTNKDGSRVFNYAHHLTEVRCVIEFPNITVISPYSTLHELSLDANLQFFNKIPEADIIPITGLNKYIQTNVDIGAHVDLTPIDINDFCYYIIDCTEGERFTIVGEGANSGRLWAFIDENGNLLEKDSPSFPTPNKLFVRQEIICAPESASKLIVNTGIRRGPIVCRGYIQDGLILDGDNMVSGNNAYIRTGISQGETVRLTPIAFDNYHYSVVPCYYGEKFTIAGMAGSGGRLWAFVDGDNKLLQSADKNEYLLGDIITAPKDAVKLIFNSSTRYQSFLYKGEQYLIGDEIKRGAVEKAQIVSLPKDKICQPTIDYYSEINTGVNEPACAKGTIYKNGNNFCITYGENLIGNAIDIPELTPTGTLAMKYKYFKLNGNIESDVSYGTFAQKGTQYIDIDGNPAEFVGGCGLPCGTINNIQYFSSVLSGNGHFLENGQVPLCVCCPVTVDDNGVSFGTIQELSLTINGVRGRFDVGRIDKDYVVLYYTTAAPYYDGAMYHWCLPVNKSIVYLSSPDGINWTLISTFKVPLQLFGEISCTKIGTDRIIFAARCQNITGRDEPYGKDSTYIGEFVYNSNMLTSLYKLSSISVRAFVYSTNNNNRKLLFVNTNSKNVLDVIEIVKRSNDGLYFYKWFSVNTKCTWYTSALQSLVQTDFSEMYLIGGNGELVSASGMTFVKLAFDNKPKYIDDIPFGIS